MITVKILDPVWPNRNRLAAGRRAEFVQVADCNDSPALPMLSFPGLAINKKQVCSGRIPNQREASISTGQSREPQP